MDFEEGRERGISFRFGSIFEKGERKFDLEEIEFIWRVSFEERDERGVKIKVEDEEGERELWERGWDKK